MTNVIPMFDFNGVRLRGTIIDDQPWFVATDVCRCLGLDPNNASTHCKKLDADERQMRETPKSLQGQGAAPRAILISEAGLYKLTQRSTKPAAAAFDRWVRHEVLPSIRRTGGYVMRDAEVEAVLDQQPSNPALTHSRYPSQRRTGR